MFESENWIEVVCFVDYIMDERPSMSQSVDLKTSKYVKS